MDYPMVVLHESEKPDLYILVWEDAWKESTAEITLLDVKDKHKPSTINTVGWLLLSDEKGVSIANEDTGDGVYRGGTFVPSGMIKSLKKYKAPRNRRTIKPKPEVSTTD